MIIDAMLKKEVMHSLREELKEETVPLYNNNDMNKRNNI